MPLKDHYFDGSNGNVDRTQELVLYIRSSNVYKEIETLENNKKEKYTQV
jgi:hypothetical protein